jgi:hypothetical protein
MLQTVRDACQFDDRAINYALSDQVEDLDSLISHDRQSAESFFKKTFVTGGMAVLIRQGLQRLAGKPGQAVFELRQAMGGGKTHSMLALGYLAANPELKDLVPSDITKDIEIPKAHVVAISGRSISRDKHLWGDIATQLGKADAFVEFYKGAPQAPNEKDWISLIGETPTLILLDELPPYFANAVTQPVGAGTLANVVTYALGNLLSAALKVKHLCIVISNLSGAYEDATKDIANLVQRSMHDLQQEAGRQAKGITPVELGSDEIYHILRKRLLVIEPARKVVETVATAFSEAISDAIKAKTVAKSAAQIADEVVASYPFHPSFKHILALFKDNEQFRQTRGLMTLAAIMVKSVQDRITNDVYLIGCQHMCLANPDVRDAITNIYDLSSAIAQDIAGTGADQGHAQVIDEQMESDAASQVAALLLVSSLPEANGAVKGLTKEQTVENLISPLRTTSEFEDAFDKLQASCWYLHPRENGSWYFSRNENIKKKIGKYAETAPSPKIQAEMERRLSSVFQARKRTAYSEVRALPKIDDIKPTGGRMLLVLSPDHKVPPEEAEQLFKSILQRNNFCVVTGDGSDLAKLEDKVRRIWAIAKVRDEDGGDRSPNVSVLNDEAEQAEFDFHATIKSLFNRVIYPGRHPRGGEGLLYAPLKLVETKSEDGKRASIDGESAVEDALASMGASKLERSVDDANIDSLRARAEDLLWPPGRRAKWRDIEEQAICNVRWKWLPPKSLDELRQRAVASGDWRDNGDGYIEKGPFPKPKTSVKAVTKQRDDLGNATIELTAIGAGPNARIYLSNSPDVTALSPLVDDTVITRNDSVLWFLAIDPDGKHETGEPEQWRNTLSLTHDESDVMGKRRVTLDVRPRGEIRWNMDGTNPSEGRPYDGPIEISGDAETTIYAYAEDAGLSIKKSFLIRSSRAGAAAIDPDKPATVPKKRRLLTTADTFAVLRAGKISGVLFGNGVTVTVGKGDQNAVTRFGPGTSLTADAIDLFIASSRASLQNENADVEVGFGEMVFQRGSDLLEFLAQVTGQLTVEAAEVVQ